MMNKETLASIITRLHFCGNTKLENIDDWFKMRNFLLKLDEGEFDKKLKQFGLLDKEAS